MQYADVKSTLAVVNTMADEGNRVVVGLADTYVEHLMAGWRIPTCCKNGVFVL